MSSTLPNWVFVPGHYVPGHFVNMNKKENKKENKDKSGGRNWVWGPVCGCGTQCGCPFGYKSKCWDFKKTGKCPRGNKCKFAHSS